MALQQGPMPIHVIPFEQPVEPSGQATPGWWERYFVTGTTGRWIADHWQPLALGAAALLVLPMVLAQRRRR